MQIEIGNYKKLEKGALKGFFELFIHDWELKIIDFTHFANGTKEWFNFPQKEIKRKDGEKSSYFPYVSIMNSGVKTEIDYLVRTQLKELKPEQFHVTRSPTKPANPVQSESSELWF